MRSLLHELAYGSGLVDAKGLVHEQSAEVGARDLGSLTLAITYIAKPRRAQLMRYSHH